MKMKRASIKFNPVDSYMSGNLQSSNLDDKRKRLERRWRRREIMVNSLKHNRVASATKTTVKICGNTDALIDKNDHTTDDEEDEEWKTFLAAYTSDDEMDEDYGSFWVTFNSDIETDCVSNHNGGSKIDTSEIDVDYISFLETYDSNVENESVDNHSGGSNIDINYANNKFSEEIEEDYNHFSNQFVSTDISKEIDEDEDDQLLSKSSNVEPNLPVSDKKIDTPEVREVQCVVDEDYEQILNSGWIVDGDFVYGCDKNIKNTLNVDDESNSSDSDLIVLESYQNCESTPFVSSKAYDSSCFGEEMHPKDNMQMTSFYHSQFRKRLVEYLDRPFDYEEYKSLLVEAYERKQKERHLETRRGVIKSYHSEGVTKSYLDLHPDVAKAIAMESKEKPRVLFLLRGFFFWLKNAPHEGKFQPWCDESCLEMMRKL